MISNILVLTPPAYPHWQALSEVAMSFSKSLQELGHEAVLTVNSDDCEGQTLAFGAHLIPKYEGKIEGDYIIYQTEQLAANDSLFVDEAYLDILRRFPVWDYSPDNIEYLKSKGINAKYMPIGYHPSMSNLKKKKSITLVGKAGESKLDFAPWGGVLGTEDIDICFFGSMNERRQKIIDDLRKVEIDGKPLVMAVLPGYGAWRDKLIDRSKICLNMHYYDSSIFEIFRCAHYMANKKAIVSELGKDKELESLYCDGVSFCEYDSVVDNIVGLLKDVDTRERFAQKAFDIFSKVKQKNILQSIQAYEKTA